eukprot:TRINITY_DN27461_c0_g1_i1.p1 TRINITY_DN27461_c0_g1~~TRINITY_DN27461_c0_g1_i1.p1  ORF type:complete len:349 (+),score=106.48 TRINITY_DN27461_c0_g1_i1:66-1049(+)
MARLCGSEETFVLGGVADNVRADGRGRMEMRNVTVATDVMDTSNCYGSARVTLGGTEVVVCISAEIGQVTDAGLGRLELAVSSTPGASESLAKMGRRQVQAQQDFNGLLAHRLRSMLAAGGTEEERRHLEGGEMPYVPASEAVERDPAVGAGEPASTAIDYRSLFIRDDKCWVLTADVMVLRNTGNILSAASMACRAALTSTRLPKVVVHDDVPGDEGIEVSGNDADAIPISGASENVPICVTACKLGEHIITDPSSLEEACPHTAYYIGFTPSLDVSCLLTSLSSSGLAAHYSRIGDVSTILNTSAGIAKAMFATLEEQMEQAMED